MRPATDHLVLADAWRGRHGNQARQPEAAANHLPPYRKQAMGSPAAWRRVSCGPNAATYIGPRPAHAFPACYETSAIITDFSLTRSYPMMGEEG